MTERERNEMTREITQLSLTREELRAALVEDSIGYLTPRSAELHIERWEQGDERCFCERCAHVFKDDLQRCIESAASRWDYLSEEKQKKLLDVVEKISRLDDIGQMTVSLMWPTSV